jgi:hypothetical protein
MSVRDLMDTNMELDIQSMKSKISQVCEWMGRNNAFPGIESCLGLILKLEKLVSL